MQVATHSGADLIFLRLRESRGIMIYFFNIFFPQESVQTGVARYEWPEHDLSSAGISRVTFSPIQSPIGRFHRGLEGDQSDSVGGGRGTGRQVK